MEAPEKIEALPVTEPTYQSPDQIGLTTTTSPPPGDCASAQQTSVAMGPVPPRTEALSVTETIYQRPMQAEIFTATQLPAGTDMSAEQTSVAMGPVPPRTEALSVTEPFYQRPMQAEIFTATQLPAGTYMSAEQSGFAMGAFARNEALPLHEPVYQNAACPEFFTSTHMPAGTYLSAGFPSMSANEEALLNVKLKKLGSGQVMSGIGSILLGTLIILVSRWYVSFVIVLGTPWWTGLFSTVSGMMALGVRNSTQASMMVGCLIMNIINALACVPAVILYAMSINFYPCFGYICWISAHVRLISTLMIFLLFNCLLSLLLSIVVATVNCKRLRCCTSDSPMTMIMVQPGPAPPQASGYSNYPPNEQPPAYFESPKPMYNVPV